MGDQRGNEHVINGTIQSILQLDQIVHDSAEVVISYLTQKVRHIIERVQPSIMFGVKPMLAQLLHQFICT